MGGKPRASLELVEYWREESEDFFEALDSDDFDRLDAVVERADQLLKHVPASLKDIRRRLRSVSVAHAEALRCLDMGEPAPAAEQPPTGKPASTPKPAARVSESKTAMPESVAPGTICIYGIKEESSDVVVRENFVLTLFMRRKFNGALAKRASAFFADWIELAEDALRFATIGSSSTSTKEVTPSLLERAHKRFERDAKAGATHYMHLYGPQKRCPDFSFVSNFKDPEDRQMGWGRYFTTNKVELYFPVSFFEACGADAVVQLVLKLASRLPYDSGIAGWALHDVNHHFSCRGEPKKKVGELALRYPGYFISDGGSYSSHTMGDRASGSQWLTLVGPKLLEELGGRASAEALGSEIVVHPCGQGVLVQAGPGPIVGRNDDELAAYRKVARWLQPVCAPPSRAVGNYVGPAEAEAWQRRYL